MEVKRRWENRKFPIFILESLNNGTAIRPANFCAVNCNENKSNEQLQKPKDLCQKKVPCK